ncbi:MAG: M48 family metallopeptidase [Parachlamydia sp.]|nr:M48 family metallopeptidase [Parachlamydia sp.]
MRISSIGHKAERAWDATCQTVKSVAHKIHDAVIKVVDFVLPRNPVTKRREFRFVPLWMENSLGLSLFNRACPNDKICKDPILVNRVENVFKRVVSQCDRKELNYEIRVMQDDKTINAFCAPGGKVIITTALLRELQKDIPVDAGSRDVTFEDKVAAVLGHEVTHAAAGHGARSIQLGLLIALVGKIVSIVVPRIVLQPGKNEARWKYETRVRLLESTLDIGWTVGGFFFKQHHSRCHEFESDKFGIKYAAKAGYRPEGALWIQQLFMKMDKEKQAGKPEPEMFRSHPFSVKRLEANRKTIDRINSVGIEKAFA